MSETLLQSPLNQTHRNLGAKMGEFGGWEMPLEYKGVIEEHQTVRNRAGLFDISHMGQIKVEGEKSFNFLQYMTTNDLSKINDNQIQYTLMCNPEGGVVDDLLVYRLGQNQYQLVVNAVNTKKDYDWLKDHLVQGCRITDQSSLVGKLAFQGPLSQEVLQSLTDCNLEDIGFFRFEDKVDIAGEPVLVSRTGYTGEDGFEIYSEGSIKRIWNAILKKGKNKGVQPVGLGARNTLRFEACLSLYGHEIDENRNPLAAGLGRFVVLKKQDFIGKEALQEINDSDLSEVLVGLEMKDRGIPRRCYKIFKNDQKIGEITSGSYAPTLDKNLGLGYVQSEFQKVGTELEIKIRKRRLQAEIVTTPFYKRGN